MKACHHCSRELTLTAAVERTSSCPYCYSDLKCCQNCRFFDPGHNNQCREPQAEWCPEKSKANFCEFFEFLERSTIGRAGPGGGPQTDQARVRSAFDSLFKKS